MSKNVVPNLIGEQKNKKINIKKRKCLEVVKKNKKVESKQNQELHKNIQKCTLFVV